MSAEIISGTLCPASIAAFNFVTKSVAATISQFTVTSFSFSYSFSLSSILVFASSLKIFSTQIVIDFLSDAVLLSSVCVSVVLAVSVFFSVSVELLPPHAVNERANVPAITIDNSFFLI